MEYTLKRSRRRTAAIHIKDGGVEVRAPLRMPAREIDAFVMSKEKWINDNLAKQREQKARRESFIVDYGRTALFRGGEYPIAAWGRKRPGFDGAAFLMPRGLSTGEIKDACVKVYRKLAKDYLTERAFEIARHMGAKPASVRVGSAKTRWGSCSAKKNISLSWRLIMADDEVIDYVIVHEIIHLAEMNHSARFWSAVEGALPDYRERRARLNILQRRLTSEPWG